MNVWREYWLVRLGIAVAIAALLFVSSRSDAQQRQFCDTERAVTDLLYRNYKEFVVWSGDTGQGGKLILTRADGEGNWTLLSVSNGRACISVAGSRSRLDKGT